MSGEEGLKLSFSDVRGMKSLRQGQAVENKENGKQRAAMRASTAKKNWR